MHIHTCPKCKTSKPLDAYRYDGVQWDGPVALALCYTCPCGGSSMIEVPEGATLADVQKTYGVAT